MSEKARPRTREEESCGSSFTLIAGWVGLRAPGGLSLLHTAIVGVVAGIGFTVALFFTTAAFPSGAVLDEVKMGAPFSFLAAPLAIGLGRIAGLPGRAMR